MCWRKINLTENLGEDLGEDFESNLRIFSKQEKFSVKIRAKFLEKKMR